MKINLGCGGEHKKGYLNVDAFDNTIADKKMHAVDLKLKENSIDEILMSQVIEHFGIAQTLYVLSECFRVLKPGSKLIIETPNIRKSFEIYLNGDRENRKNILPWIYGVDLPGMQHRFCFPEDLLEEELKKIGFINIKKSYLEFDEYEPILRVTCKKNDEYKIFQILTYLRKKLLYSKEIDLDNQINALSKEEIICFFEEELKKYLKKMDNTILEKMIVDGAVESPKITYLFFKILKEQKIISQKIGNNYIQILKMLNYKNFLEFLLNKLTITDGFIGRQEELLKKVKIFGKKIVKKLLILTKDERDEFIKIEYKKNKIKVKYKIDFLSQKLIMLKAYNFFQKGVKEFNLSKFEKAIIYFEKSSLLYRDQILTYWNLGRLITITRNKDKAKNHYNRCLQLLKYLKIDQEAKIKEIIKKEMNSKKLSAHRNSLISLRNIFDK